MRYVRAGSSMDLGGVLECLQAIASSLHRGAAVLCVGLTLGACSPQLIGTTVQAKKKALDGSIAATAVTVTPSTGTLTVSSTLSLSASGGFAPYTYSIFSGPATISAGGVLSPTGTGTAVVLLQDSVGASALGTFTIVADVTITPSTTVLAINGTQTFVAAGGVAPYTFSVVAGTGTVNASSGLYTAPASAGTATVRVTDSLGNAANATITINNSLTISPSSVTLAVNNSLTFTASAGVGPYTYSIVAGGGSINATTGAFTAPAAAGSVTVRVTDSLANTSDSVVTVNAALAISPATVTLAVNDTQTFSATGGVVPYTYSIVAGGGSINASSGAFTAPAAAGSVTVRVTDSLGNTSNSTVTVNAALAISPSSISLAVNNTTTFTATGGVTPYTYSIVAGGGSINGTTGAFTAPAAAGSVTVRVTDSASHTSNATVTVNAALAISPASITLAVNNTTTFTAAGGVTPYTYSIVAGGGSINGTTGAFTAPAAASSVTVRVTDAVSNTSNATVTVNAALAISPATVTLAINNTQTFSATGGVAPYVYSIVAGGGSINSSSGAFTAPGAAGSVTVRVTDALSNTSNSAVTVVNSLAISPASVTLVVNGTQTFTAANGVGPFVYSIVSGGGSINGTTGAFTAPAAAGAVTVRVTDSLSNTSDAAVTVNAALAISPSTLTLAVNNTTSFSATGGISPYTYSIVAGGGSINASTGAFTAPAAAGSVTVRVTDSASNTSDATVTVNAALAISPSSISLAVNNTTTFTATGGVTPYTYSIVAGGGSINGTTGAFTAPAAAGSVTVRVTDALSNTSNSTVTVNAALAISPASITLAVNNSTTFTATGGVTPYTYSIVAGGGSINGSTGAFTAPAAAGSVTVRVTDSLANTSNSTVTVNAALAISPSSISLAVNNTTTFTATGGVGSYTYSIVAGGGSINGTTGAFTAPAAAGSVTVRVTDSLSNTSNSTVTVNAALAISPATITLAVNNTTTFTATGGVTPYTYSIVAGGGSINGSTGAFTAPAAAGSVTVRVTDSLSNTSDSTVTVNAALAISPSSISLAVNNSTTFTATGGVGSYTYSIVAGGGSINGSTGAFTAPAAAGAVTVRVTDSLSNTSNSTVTVNAALAISPSTLTIVVNGTQTFSATGGVSPYTYSIAAGGGSINASTGAYTAPAGAGAVTVRVTDSLSNASDSTVTVNAALAISPSSITLAVGNSTTFSATGGVPSNTFSIVAGGGSINGTTGAFTAPAGAGSVTVRVTDSASHTSDSTVTVNAALAISPSSVTLRVGQTQAFTSTGGVPTTTYSITGSPIGSLSSGTYSHPWLTGTDTVRATDSIGNTSDATVTLATGSIQIGNTGSDNVNNMVRDSSGNFYVVGNAAGSIFGMSYVGGTSDGYVAKFDANGNRLWSKFIGTTAADTSSGVAVFNSSGNVYVVGLSAGNLDGETNTGGNDAYVTKFNSSGVRQWTRLLGSSGGYDDNWGQVVVDQTSENIYVGGNTMGNFDGNSNGSSPGSLDWILGAYDKDGTKLWTKEYGSGAGNEWDYVTGMSITSTGVLYAVGVGFTGFDGKTSTGDVDIVLTRINTSTGAITWSVMEGSTLNDSSEKMYCDPTSGNCYIAGKTAGNLFGGTNAGGSDFYIVKYNSSGVRQWSQQMGTASNDRAIGLAVNAAETYVYGIGWSAGAFDGGTNAGGNDMVLVKFDASTGAKQWSREWGTASADTGSCGFVDSSGYVVLGGSTSGALDGNTNAGASDGVIFKFDSSGNRQ